MPDTKRPASSPLAIISDHFSRLTADALKESQEALADETRSNLAKILAKTSRVLAEKKHIPVDTASDLLKTILSASKLHAWDAPKQAAVSVTVNTHAGPIAIVGDEERARAIEQLEKARARALATVVDTKPLAQGERAPESQLALPEPAHEPQDLIDPYETPTDSIQAEALARRTRERALE